MAGDRIRVAARIRPLSVQEEERGDVASMYIQDSSTLVVVPPPGSRLSTGGGAVGASNGQDGDDRAGGDAFGFDDTFASPAGEACDVLQEQVYEQIGRPVLHCALGGVSGCLFAYGQTGSGKTYALFGTEEAPGVLSRLASELLEAKRQVESHAADGGPEEFSVKAAFLELYNENLVDLLSESRDPLRLFENSREGVVVPGLSESEVGSMDEFHALLEFALQGRSTGATCVNAHSSRSHALIQLKVQRTNHESTTRAKIHIIDLAGSERQKKAKNEGTRMREGIHINVSLSALGLVISRLSDIAQGRQHHSVPFRDSKLTFLLKDSLAGNSRTQVLVALSPAASSYEESLSTLRFAQSVKRVRTRAVADVVKVQSRDVQALQVEVERLQAELDSLRAAPTIPRQPVVGIGSATVGSCDGHDEVAVCSLEGRYLSPTMRLIEVGGDGFVRFLGGCGHHPIRILSPALADSSGDGGALIKLQSEGDPDYRYILVANSEGFLVWRHEDQSHDPAEVRWQRISSTVASEGRISQALRALQQLSGESAALQAVVEAIPALARGVKPTAALEAIDALVLLCVDIDEANSLLDRNAANSAPLMITPATPGRAPRQLNGPLRLEATWLAPEANPELMAPELLHVKVLRPSVGAMLADCDATAKILPRTQLYEVWSLQDFARHFYAFKKQGMDDPALNSSGISSSSSGQPSSLKQRYDQLCGYGGSGLDSVASETPRGNRRMSSKRNASPDVTPLRPADASPSCGLDLSVTPSSGKPSPSVQSSFPFPAASYDTAGRVPQISLASLRITPGADSSVTPRRSMSPEEMPRPAATPSLMPPKGASVARSLPSGLGTSSIEGCSSSLALPGSLTTNNAASGLLAAATPGASNGAQPLQGCYVSSTGMVIEVEADGVVRYRDGRILYLAPCDGRLILRSPDGADDSRTYRLLTREPSGVVVWDRQDDGEDDGDVSGAWRRGSSVDSQDGLLMWTPMNLAECQSPLNLSRPIDDVTNEVLPATGSGQSGIRPQTPVFGEGGMVLSVREAERLAAGRGLGGGLGAAQRLSAFNSARGAPGESSPRPASKTPSASSSAAPRSAIVNPWNGTPPVPGPMSPPVTLVVGSSASPDLSGRRGHSSGGGGNFSAVARGGGSLNVPVGSFGGCGGARPHSAEHNRDITAVQASVAAAASAAARGPRRSRTPSTAGGNGSRRRSQSEATNRTVRPKLGTSAGAGEAGVAAKAFDKNSLRLRNGSIFVDALAKWRAAHARCKPQPPRRLLPGMCAVYVRKRPMFERDTKRCDFDVLTVVGSGAGDGDIASDSNSEDDSAEQPNTRHIGQEMVHHACMFDRSLVTPFVHHTTFPYDGVFDAESSNEDVYHVVGRPLLENALAGNLATLFVFGQTGSGKTFTMRAIERMIAAELFKQLGEAVQVSLTYFELAGRKALDLLTDQKVEIRLREEEDGCFRPHDCEEASATDAEDLLRIMGEAYGRRATDATTVNSVSSRSHAVCRISVPSKGGRRGGGSGSSKPGCLLLVDCAGTERSRDTLYFKGQHQKESADINSSLFALKDCIRFRQAAIHRNGGLPQDGASLKLPSVRATPLTKVLAEALTNASAQLAAIATVSPNATDAEHTIDTLRTVYTLSGRAEARVTEVRQVFE